MRNTIITLVLLLLVAALCQAQGLRYEVRKAYSRPVTKETLQAAKTMSDISPGYPSSWITEYVSTEIIGISKGNVIRAKGINETLNEDQLQILKTADSGSDIIFDIDYKYVNPITGNLDPRIIHFTLTVSPGVEAEFPGGNEKLNRYLEDNAIFKISEHDSKTIQPVLIRFTITETGEIANAQIANSSENPGVDKLLLKAIKKMPKWKPAINLDGKKVKQNFEFSVGNGGC